MPSRREPAGLDLRHVHVSVHGQSAGPGPGCIILVEEHDGPGDGGPSPGRPGALLCSLAGFPDERARSRAKDTLNGLPEWEGDD